LDGGTPKPRTLFFTFTRNIRPGFFPLYTQLPIEQHTVIVDIFPDPPDKEGILAAKNQTISLEYQTKTDWILVAFCFL
jgi:hypothetical protein